MRSLKKLPWTTVVVLMILAMLIMTGHNGAITYSLVGVVAAYLGLDIAVFRKWQARK